MMKSNRGWDSKVATTRAGAAGLVRRLRNAVPVASELHASVKDNDIQAHLTFVVWRQRKKRLLPATVGIRIFACFHRRLLRQRRYEHTP